jgi:hypothetical protein
VANTWRTFIFTCWFNLKCIRKNQFLVLDALILSHPFIRNHWAILLRSIRLVQINPAQFDLEGLFSGKLLHLNALIERLDLILMSGKILTVIIIIFCLINSKDNLFLYLEYLH